MTLDFRSELSDWEELVVDLSDVSGGRWTGGLGSLPAVFHTAKGTNPGVVGVDASKGVSLLGLADLTEGNMVCLGMGGNRAGLDLKKFDRVVLMSNHAEIISRYDLGEPVWPIEKVDKFGTLMLEPRTGVSRWFRSVDESGKLV